MINILLCKKSWLKIGFSVIKRIIQKKQIEPLGERRDSFFKN